MADAETRHVRYRQSLCVDCGERRYSAGRPRCDECHHKYERRTA
jgi:tRNA(Ile2) C34 agmatinyltransferase TiaS